MNMHKENKITKWALIFGIVIVLNLFFNYAISLVYPEPKWDDYFGRSVASSYMYENEEDCLMAGGKWYPSVKNSPETPSTSWCDPNYEKQIEYDEKREVYNRNVFLILTLLGTISIISAVFIPISVLALGFSWGGVLSLVIASLRYWNSADSFVKVLILFTALASLVAIAVKKFSDK